MVILSTIYHEPVKVDIPASSAAIQSLLEASSGSEHSWEVGWTLAAHVNSPRMDHVQTQVGLLETLLVAFLFVLGSYEMVLPLHDLRFSEMNFMELIK